MAKDLESKLKGSEVKDSEGNKIILSWKMFSKCCTQSPFESLIKFQGHFPKVFLLDPMKFFLPLHLF